MLSGLSDTSGKYGFSLSGSQMTSGDITYNSSVLGLRYKVLDWFQITGSIPYGDIHSTETYTNSFTDINGTIIKEKTKVRYKQSGLGDISLMGWVDLAYPFLSREEDNGPSKEAEAEQEPFVGIGDPSVFLGVGVKLDTGTHDRRSKDKYRYDRKIATESGNPKEYSISDGAIPAYYQLGTGTTDLLLGLFYKQRFGRFVPNAGVSYKHSGGRNSVGYERGDMISWGTGLKYIILRGEDCSQFYVRGGLSGLVVIEPDVDHSENTSLIGPQQVGDVENTKGSYAFYDVGLGYDMSKNLSIIAGAKFPLTDHNNDTDNSFDRQVSLSLQYRF